MSTPAEMLRKWAIVADADVEDAVAELDQVRARIESLTSHIATRTQDSIDIRAAADLLDAR